MTSKIKIEKFSVIGIEARTNNALEMSSQGIIPKQWQKFMSQGLLQTIPSKLNDSVIAGYTEYQSNKDGDYTYFLGAQVSSLSVIPEGMVGKTVEAREYKRYESQKAPVWKVVQEVWKEIWNSGEESEAGRAYQFDFEIYDHRAADPNNGMVDVYIGLK